MSIRAQFALFIAILATTNGRAQEDIPEQAALRAEYPERIRPLFENYCIRCHDQDTESKVRLDTIDPTIAPNTIDTWTRVKNVLSGSMPPPKAKKRPSPQDLDALLSWIDGSLKRFDADQKESGGDTLIRRINNRAYANMLKTLLGVPAQGMENFPEDGAVQGFDTVGSGLYASTYLYKLCINSAKQTLDVALPTSEAWPEILEKKWNAKESKMRQFQQDCKIDDNRIRTLSENPKSDNDFLSVLPCERRAVATHYGLKDFNDLAPKGIVWTNDPKCMEEVISALKEDIKKIQAIDAAAVADFQLERSAKLTMTVAQPGRYRLSARLCLSNANYPQPVHILMDSVYVLKNLLLDDPPSAPKTYEVDVFLNKGSHTFTVFAAIPYLNNVFCRHANATYGLTLTGQDFTPKYFLTSDELTKGIAVPMILCSDMAVRGPLYDSWPLPAVAHIFTRGVNSPPTRECAEEIVLSFMRRAYAGDCDVSVARPYVGLIMSKFESGHNFLEAVKYGLAAVLCSPRFLYLGEEQRPESAHRKTLSAFELGRRLAYFLWSDLPDDVLMASAASGALLDEQELLAQTRRMIKDPRSRAFREAFTTQWLKIDKLESLSVSQEMFPAFDPVLQEFAKEESVAYFSEILDRNESFLEFIDSDFSMLNGRLAQHYGIDRIAGNEMRRVPFPKDSHRGGVLTQASVLMATSNGMESSPVRRGAFVMDRLLGVSPGVPPPDVPALDKTDTEKPDKTLFTPRERLAMHRENMSCARCHDKIDPLGVGLENFNAVGSWITKQSLPLPSVSKSKKPQWEEHVVDASGAMLDGTKYNGPDELKQRLMEHKDQFARCFAEKLTIYALGRSLELSDQPVLDKLCAHVAAENYGLATMVENVILSELFRNK